MARNRAGEDREAKRGEILQEATRLFLERGYDATSMQALAKAAGITTTTIYWYFADKDDLLVAVVDRALSDALAELYAAPPPTLPERLLAVTEVLDRSERLIAAVHARAPHAAVVAEWHDRFHQVADATLVAEARAHLAGRGRDHIPEAALAALPRIWSFTIEGMVGHALPPAERLAICELLVRQLDALPAAAADARSAGAGLSRRRRR